MPALVSPSNAMSCPALHTRPAHGNQEDRDGEGDGDPGDVEYVAERIVRGGRLERLRLLDLREQHVSSTVFPYRTCGIGWAASITAVIR
jgi:hypothetical protein